MMDGMDGMYGTNGMLGYGVMALLWLVFILLLVAGVVALVRTLSNRGTANRGSSAMTILEERFARVEIDRQEFEERRRALHP